MEGSKVEHPSVEERRALGKEARKQVDPSSHAGWEPAADRPDPVGLLEEQDATREPDLVPVRHGRMMVSPFTFYRGAAKIMAADLKDTPRAGLTVQLCGDAHLSNFGVFASPERQLLFDLNDFDETLPGPFEYDVKRMAASFTIAARNNGFSKAEGRDATLASVSAYRTAMAEFAEMSTMDIWYAASVRGRADGGDRQVQATRTSRRRRRRSRSEEASREGRREGAHARQPAGAVEARRAGRRPVPDRQPAADRRPGARPRRDVRHLCRRAGATRSTSSSAPTGPRCRTIGATCWSGSRSSTWLARSWVSAASARGRSSSCCRAAISRTRCSCRSRRRRPRCWRTTCRRAATSSPASASCRGSG